MLETIQLCANKTICEIAIFLNHLCECEQKIYTKENYSCKNILNNLTVCKQMSFD